MSFCKSRVPRSTTLRELHGDLGCGLSKQIESKSPLPGPGSYNPYQPRSRSRSCGSTITSKSVRDTNDWLVRRSFGSKATSISSSNCATNPPLYNIRDSKSLERKSFNFAHRLSAPSISFSTKSRQQRHVTRNGMLIGDKYYPNETVRDLSASRNVSDYASPTRRIAVSPRYGEQALDIEEEVPYSPISFGSAGRPYPVKLAQEAKKRGILSLDAEEVHDLIESGVSSPGRSTMPQTPPRSASPVRAEVSPTRFESSEIKVKHGLPKSPNKGKIFKPTLDRYQNKQTSILLSSSNEDLGSNSMIDRNLRHSEKRNPANYNTNSHNANGRPKTPNASKTPNNRLPIEGFNPLARSRSAPKFLPKARVQTYYQKVDHTKSVSGAPIERKYDPASVANLKSIRGGPDPLEGLGDRSSKSSATARSQGPNNATTARSRRSQSPNMNSFGQAVFEVSMKTKSMDEKSAHRPQVFLKSHGAYGKRGETHAGTEVNDALNYRGNYRDTAHRERTNRDGSSKTPSMGPAASTNSARTGVSTSTIRNGPRVRDLIPDEEIQHRKKLQESITLQIAQNREKLERRSRLLQKKRAEIRGQVYGDLMNQYEQQYRRGPATLNSEDVLLGSNVSAPQDGRVGTDFLAGKNNSALAGKNNDAMVNMEGIHRDSRAGASSMSASNTGSMDHSNSRTVPGTMNNSNGGTVNDSNLGTLNNSSKAGSARDADPMTNLLDTPEEDAEREKKFDYAAFNAGHGEDFYHYYPDAVTPTGTFKKRPKTFKGSSNFSSFRPTSRSTSSLRSTQVLAKTRGASKLMDQMIAIQNRSNAFAAKTITQSGVRY